MIETIINSTVDFLNSLLGATGLGRHALVFLLSLLPAISSPAIVIPIGAALGLPAITNVLAIAIGNILPVPFIIIYLRKMLALMRKKSKYFAELADKYEKRTRSREKQLKYGAFAGLFFFVALPLPIPGMGAWSASMLASIFDIRLKTAFPAIALGVIVSSIIAGSATYGFLALLSFSTR